MRFICLPAVKRPAFFFQGLYSLNPPPMIRHESVMELSAPRAPHLHFTTFKNSIFFSKTDISKTAWINAWSFPYWLSFYFIDKFNFYWCCNTFLTNTAIDCFQLFLHAIIWKWCHCCYYQLLLYLHFSLIYMSVLL